MILKTNSNEWMSISDMMSGLMLIFLFIAVSFMITIESEKEKMKDIAIEYRDTKANLNEALFAEFENDLETWDAILTKDNSITFYSPDVLFEVNKSEIKEEFKGVLEAFFSRYVKILTAQEYKDEIQELRIQGHTSAEWGKSVSRTEIYLKNMQLSQKRAYSVLSFCYALEDENIKSNKEWLEKHLRANGMAFAKLIDKSKARRVEFSIQMKSEDKVYEILR